MFIQFHLRRRRLRRSLVVGCHRFFQGVGQTAGCCSVLMKRIPASRGGISFAPTFVRQSALDRLVLCVLDASLDVGLYYRTTDSE